MNCYICEEVLKSKEDKKKHLKTHSYKTASYRCEECEFIGSTMVTMDVHSGKFHSKKFVCGLCDYEAGSLENLDMHLFTCEMFECCRCDDRMLKLADLKDHIRSAHGNRYEEGEKIAGIVHLKMDRNSYSEVTQKTYSYEELLNRSKS